MHDFRAGVRRFSLNSRTTPTNGSEMRRAVPRGSVQSIQATRAPSTRPHSLSNLAVTADTVVPSEARDAVISLRDVAKVFVSTQTPCIALEQISLDVRAGAFVALVGASGSGKSTLLNLISGIDRPTRGEVRVAGTRVDTLPEKAMAPWRGRAVGIVFQFFQLIPTLSALENVLIAMDFCGVWPASERVERAQTLLSRLGVADQADKRPNTMSGGQQQRVAVARALANAPAVLLADEATGNLDSRTAASLLDLLASLAADGQTVVMATHDHSVQRVASRTITLQDGRVLTDSANLLAAPRDA